MSTNEKLSPGMVLGRYELLIPIAQGGMATVWAARQRGSRGFNKTVAIKTMLPALSEDPQFEQMFLDEAALAAKIHHPHVCEILDLGEQDEVLYIVMEWIDGEALSVIHKASRKNQAEVPIRLTMRMLAQACSGLHAAHELRDENEVPLLLVHRDVSPQNVLVTYDGIVKLVDFGVAKAMGRAGGETNAGQLKGKVPYMSPEQARGGLVDRRTDVFAMGIVLYKLTTGLHPFMGENDLVTMRNIISRPLLPPRVKNPSFPAEVEQILLKCLQKDPDKRYQTMAELGSAIEKAGALLGGHEEDLGTYVRTLMGERGAKRRAAVRDAVRAADERFATGTHQMVQLPTQAPQPTVHDAVSDIVLTKMNSGVNNELIGDRPSLATPPTTQAPQSSPGSYPGTQHSTTDQPVIAEEIIPLRKSRSGLFAGLGAVAVAAIVVTVVMLRSGGTSAQGGQPPPPPKVSATAPVTTTVATAAPPPPVPTTSASAAPSTSAVSPSNLPDAETQPKKPGTGGQTPVVQNPGTPAKPSSDPNKPPPKVNTGNVPVFTNPGF